MERVKRVFSHIQSRCEAAVLSPEAAADEFPAQTNDRFSAPADDNLPAPANDRFPAPTDDDVVIVQALRSPICESHSGAFKDTFLDDLLSAVFSAVLEDVGLDPSLLQSVCIGNISQYGPFAGGGLLARTAQFFRQWRDCSTEEVQAMARLPPESDRSSDIPPTVPIMLVNRFCGSGIEACANIASSIRLGDIDVGLAGGAEITSYMSKKANIPTFNPRVLENVDAYETLIFPARSSDIVGQKNGYTREMQDQIAYESHMKAAAAHRNGYFKEEMVPVRTTLTDKDGNQKEVVVDTDECVRPDITMAHLKKFEQIYVDGTCTPGNSTRYHDGAAAVLMARRSAAKKHNLPVLGVFRSYSVVGLKPGLTTLGSSLAIPTVLSKAGLTVDDIDIFEINETAATQISACLDLGIPRSKVNPNGGTIALGHPWGCTGSRQVATMLHELKRRGKRAFGVVSSSIGTGMGVAALLEYPGPTG